MNLVKYGPGLHRLKLETIQRRVDRAPQVDCPIRWFFAHGVAAREMTIPAETVVIGAVHKTENIAILSKGRLVFSTENGPIEISAPHTLVIKPGQKNAVSAIEECVWTNVFVTDETDPEKIIPLVSEVTADQLIGGAKNLQLLNNLKLEAV